MESHSRAGRPWPRLSPGAGSGAQKQAKKRNPLPDGPGKSGPCFGYEPAFSDADLEALTRDFKYEPAFSTTELDELTNTLTGSLMASHGEIGLTARVATLEATVLDLARTLLGDGIDELPDIAKGLAELRAAAEAQEGPSSDGRTGPEKRNIANRRPSPLATLTPWGTGAKGSHR
jgi:hypothetical protein